MGSVTLACNKMAWVKRDNPNANFSTGEWADGLKSESLSTGEYYQGFALLAFSEPPAEAKYKPITSIEISFYAKTAAQPDSYSARYFCTRFAWEENSATFNTAGGLSFILGSKSGSGAETWFSFAYSAYIDRILDALRYGVKISFSTGYNRQLNQIATRYNSNSSLRPYIVVYYSDNNVYLTPTAIQKGSYFNPHVSQSFYWSTDVSANTSYATPTQTSAQLLYKLPTDADWSVGGTVSGDATSITLDAETLPVAEELQWKVRVTDSGGTTTDSDVQTSSTQDQLITATPSSPVGGYRIDETADNTFRWNDSSPNGTPQTQADLQWSTDGSTWTDLGSVSGVYWGYTVPANTFPVAATLYWRVRSYNADGVAGAWSGAASFSTTDTLPTATPVVPNATVESGNQPIVFRWGVTNESGSEQKESELQYKVGSGSWTALATVSGSVTSYTAPANTFSAGSVQWRVRAINRQDAAGSWSAAVEFVVVAAPGTPTVSADGLPQLTVEWQGSGQQGYKIELDNAVYGPYFGTAQSWRAPEIVSNGEHTVRVALLGQYGLWSEWGGYTFAVANEPGDAVTLSGVFGVDAALSWTTESEDADYYVYRDGVRIGHTARTSFVDRFALGQHEYQVVNALESGNVTRSNTVSGSCAVECPMISPVYGGSWLALRLTDDSASETGFSWSRVHSLRHFSGATYPVLELSEYEDRSATLRAAFTSKAEAAPFEALRGQLVILKTPCGELLTGGLTGWRKTRNPHYIVYSLTIEQCDREDFVDDTDG